MVYIHVVTDKVSDLQIQVDTLSMKYTSLSTETNLEAQ